ncbi:MAG TPA: [FeFe] hydrogenase H-cluster maturation GTPase HydF [Bacteroidales bacterium]|nr:[FeFe] hydrogenase H-cluster maturation GTPase HydF [Bacteroidales bacterium]
MVKGKDLKPHIGIFGRRNNGKSSIINLMVNQEVAIVSPEPGTTTDPVKKSIEIFGIGPAIIIDTAGIDDTGELGEKRVQKSLQAIKTIDCAILVITENQFGFYEKELIKQFREHQVPYLILHNKSDLQPLEEITREKIREFSKAEVIDFTTTNQLGLEAFITALKKTIPETVYQKPSLLGGLVEPGGVVVLVTPIDSEAPDGRMILPQVMAIRDVLDNDCICVVLKETQLEQYFREGMPGPQLVVTDSQAFGFVSKVVPAEIPLTSFSIVFARLRGDFEHYLKGTAMLSALDDEDKVLILESCTHQVSCEDIGRHKLPRWIKEFTGKNVHCDIVAGLAQVADVHQYKLVIQCGGCVVTRKQLINRLRPAVNAGVAVSNYGMAIAWMNGIFGRVTQPFHKLYS